MQALDRFDRTRPRLPMTPTRAERGTHDYVRRGVTSLFAAPDVATGAVIGTCHRRHRHQEFINFLDHVDGTVVKEPGLSIHLIRDDCATHMTPAVKRWLLRHPDDHLHFIPTRSSWFNPVERFFAEITEKRIRRGAVRSVRAREKAVADSLAERNADPKPFARVADADAILDRIKEVCERTSNSGHQRVGMRGERRASLRLFSAAASLRSPRSLGGTRSRGRRRREGVEVSGRLAPTRPTTTV